MALRLRGLLWLRSVRSETASRGSGSNKRLQNALRERSKPILVYRASEADIIILVTSRPAEDLLAVYDARQGPDGNFFCRVMGRDGLQAGETPLVTQFEKGFESVQKHSK